MTKHEAAIVMAYTGVCMLKGDDFNDFFWKYCEELYGRPIYTHEFVSLAEKIAELAKPDFMELCKQIAESGDSDDE